MRHAHADCAPGQDDHARASQRTGVKMRRAGWALGSKNQVICHDHALVSDAKRTYQSFAALELTCAVDLMAQLYLAEPASLRAAINAQCHHACLLLLAHNPGIAELASTLIQTPPAHAAFYTYPPGATLVLNWKPQDGSAQLIDFIDASRSRAIKRAPKGPIQNLIECTRR